MIYKEMVIRTGALHAMARMAQILAKLAGEGEETILFEAKLSMCLDEGDTFQALCEHLDRVATKIGCARIDSCLG